MKKIFVLVIMMSMVLPMFAAKKKQAQIQIEKNAWGLEISNVDANGKKIFSKLSSNIQSGFLVLKRKSSDNFDIEKFAEYFVYNLSELPVHKMPNVFVIDGQSFKEADNSYQSRNWGGHVQAPALGYEKIPFYEYEGLALIFIEKFDFEINDNYMRLDKQELRLNVILDGETNDYFANLCRGYYEKKSIQDIINSSEKTENFAYQLDKTGEIVIAAYIGKAVENLIIPEKIEGLAVGRIYSMQSPSKVTFKSVTIPKSVKKINDNAFKNLGIENLVFEKGSQIEEIGQNAFRNNSIKQLNLPKKQITIYFDAFSDNKIKSISLYKDWGFVYHTTAGYFNLYENPSDSAFVQSDELEEVVFEEGCSLIAPYAFANCKNLKRVSIPSSMKKFGAGAFINCSSLSEIIFAGVPIANVDKFEDIEKKAKEYLKKNGNPYDVGESILNPFAAAATARINVKTDPYSAAYSFKGCPLPLKTKSILLKMGLPEYAF